VGETRGTRRRRCRRALLVLGAAFLLLLVVVLTLVYRAVVVTSRSPSGRYSVCAIHGAGDSYRIRVTDRAARTEWVRSRQAAPSEWINGACWDHRVEWDPQERGSLFVWYQCYADSPKRFARAYVVAGSPPRLHEEAVEDHQWALELLRDTWRGHEEEEAGDPYQELYDRPDIGVGSDAP